MANCLVAQSGGPTSVINATLAGVVKANQLNPIYTTVYGGLNGIEGILQERMVDLTNMSEDENRMPPLIAVMMGVITGVFGGVLRDVLCNEVPQAFSDHRPYALCAFAGGWADIALRQLDAPAWTALISCVVVTAGLRGLALWRNWELPAWRV